MAAAELRNSSLNTYDPTTPERLVKLLMDSLVQDKITYKIELIWGVFLGVVSEPMIWLFIIPIILRLHFPFTGRPMKSYIQKKRAMFRFGSLVQVGEWRWTKKE
jgi:hypothetical protein